MARITFSPLVVAASGKVKDTVFSKWKGRNYIRARVVPANPQSAAQTLVRNSLARCVELWQSLAAWYHNVWDLYATPYSLSGYNTFVKANRALEQAASELKATPHNAAIEKHSAFAAATGSGSGEIDLTWSGGTVGASYWFGCLVRKTGTNIFTSASFEVTLNSVGSETISGLTPNTSYQCYGLVTDDATNQASESLSDTATSQT